jgi:hypothetical protein
LFSDEGKSLIIQALDGAAPMSGSPRVVSIDFPQGQWYNRSEYVINMEMDELGPEKEDSFTENITEAGESWGIETDEGTPEGLGNLSRTYRLTHSVSAVGKRRQDGSGTDVREAWNEAQVWVKSRLGFDSNIALSSGVNNLPSYYGGYNHVRNETPDKRAGSYSVEETWILASGTSLEDFTVTTNKGIEDLDTTVRIEGVITGLEQRDANLQVSTTKYSNANTRFIHASGLAFTRAQIYSGETLNIKPKTIVFGKNPIVGTINYSFEYNDRPSNLISNAKTEVISIADNVDGGNAFAELFVLGRAAGPILQDLSTRASFKRTLSLEILVNRPAVTGTVDSIKYAFYNKNPRADASTSGDIANLITAIDPASIGINASHSDNPQENWDFRNGRYSYSQTWTYVPSG